MRLRLGSLVFSHTQLLIYLTLGQLNSALLEIRIRFDIFSIVFLNTVVLISFAVFRFRYSYMAANKFFSRFKVLLFVFVFSMLLLIASSNLIFTIVGWDGLGIRSYLLVIYYGRRKSYNAGILTVLRNRIGDVAILFRIGLILQLGSWNIPYYKELFSYNTYFSFLLALGGFTKSAQIPFSAWLPAAIAAPTPVSSLVHSSTLVTAGVFLLFRHLSELTYSTFYSVLLFIGIRTMTIARIAALNEKDIKKIVALSTLRQLGLIVLSLGLGWIFISFFHLIIHAFFKAMIFISVGNLIHFSQNYQAIKNRGGIALSSPLNSSTLILASLRLCGVPFTAAFFSKEPIIELSCQTTIYLGVNTFIILSVFFTVMYRARLFKLVRIRFNSVLPLNILRESDPLLRKGILTLAIPSFTSGASLRVLISPIPTAFFYTQNVKFLILTRISLIILTFVLPRYSIWFKGSLFLFPIWGLALLSARLLIPLQKETSWDINFSTFSRPLTGLSHLADSRRMISYLFSTSYIFRWVASIPLIMLIFYLT